MTTKDWLKTRKTFEDAFEAFLILLADSEQPEVTRGALTEIVSSNLTGGKHLRGALVAAALEAFHPSEKLSANLLHSAHLVGWCIETLHAGFLVLDDIMDNSPTRRNQPSWFVQRQNGGLGSLAINDGLHMILLSKYLLHRVFRSRERTHDIYFKVLQLFDFVTYYTCWGQHLDCIYSQTPGCIPLSLANYTKINVDVTAKWKTGFYSFYLPVACGMAMAGVKNEETYSKASNILLKLGQYFQAQDDFLDCFGDPAITGKLGTDITDGKCSWLVAECLAQATPEQRQIIQDNYGRPGAETVAAVRAVYLDLALPEKFRTYERGIYSELIKAIDDWDSSTKEDPSGPKRLFRLLLDILFNRSY